jgi:hypothetical protein
MKAFGQLIIHLTVPYVRFWNGADIINVLWNMTTGRLVSKGKGHPITGHQGPRGGVEV